MVKAHSNIVALAKKDETLSHVLAESAPYHQRVLSLLTSNHSLPYLESQIEKSERWGVTGSDHSVPHAIAVAARWLIKMRAEGRVFDPDPPIEDDDQAARYLARLSKVFPDGGVTILYRGVRIPLVKGWSSFDYYRGRIDGSRDQLQQEM